MVTNIWIIKAKKAELRNNVKDKLKKAIEEKKTPEVLEPEQDDNTEITTEEQDDKLIISPIKKIVGILSDIFKSIKK